MSDKIKVSNKGLEAEGAPANAVVPLLKSIGGGVVNIGGGFNHIIGILGGDWLRFKRLDGITKYYSDNPELLQCFLSDPDLLAELSNIQKVAVKTAKLKAERNDDKVRKPTAKFREVAIDGIAQEDDETLQDKWAKLTDEATDPTKEEPSTHYANILKSLDSNDAWLLNILYLGEDGGAPLFSHGLINYDKLITYLRKFKGKKNLGTSVEVLAKLGCIRLGSAGDAVKIDPITRMNYSNDQAVSAVGVLSLFESLLETMGAISVFETEIGSSFAMIIGSKN